MKFSIRKSKVQSNNLSLFQIIFFIWHKQLSTDHTVTYNTTLCDIVWQLAIITNTTVLQRYDLQIKPVAIVSRCTKSISHNVLLCTTEMCTCAHFCYKMVHYGTFVWCIVEFERWARKDVEAPWNHSHRVQSYVDMPDHKSITWLPIWPTCIPYDLHTFYQQFLRWINTIKNDASWQICPNTFSCVKSFVFWLKFHWSLFLIVQLWDNLN